MKPLRVTPLRSVALAVGLALPAATCWPLMATAQVPPTPAQTLPRKEPSTKVPEATPPAQKKDESLSEKLGRNEGVIKPPAGIDPEASVPPPVPNPGTMPVIPPPGSPGNPSPERPK